MSEPTLTAGDLARLRELLFRATESARDKIALENAAVNALPLLFAAAERLAAVEAERGRLRARVASLEPALRKLDDHTRDPKEHLFGPGAARVEARRLLESPEGA